MTPSTGKVKRQLNSDSGEDLEGEVTDIGYDSYATAWRYLGVYDDYDEDESGGRRLKENDGNSNEGSRKLLWAAYYDADYSGEEIGDYQFYANDQWDNSTCTGDRCAKMDCHDIYTSNWKMIGVYKESVNFGNDNWFEQLFKHEGYCLWDGDKEENSDSSNYQFMQTMRKELPSGCTATNVFGDGSTYYYVDIKPQQQGQMTLGVYTDSSCQKESSYYSFYDYQQSSYVASSLTATASSDAFDTWNSNMDSYKICQPCRAYNRQQTYDRRRDRKKRRYLGEENDGQGDEEQNGYNCYDDADYQNCNQCYKFETHTDMQIASSSDLEKASNQGTILLIEYDNVWYGAGTVGDVVQNSSYQSSSSSYYSISSYCFIGGGFLLFFGFALRGFRKVTKRRIELATSEGTKPLSTTSRPLV